MAANFHCYYGIFGKNCFSCKFKLRSPFQVPIAVLAAIQAVFGNTVVATVGAPEKPERYHPIYSLHHAQDKLGQYVYGYATPTSAKSETKGADGVTRVSNIRWLYQF
nr:unnamed protein product [Callosobruchus analis]